MARRPPGGARAAAEKVETFEDDLDPEVLPTERRRNFSTPGFSRMRFDWRSDDAPVIRDAVNMANARILDVYRDAYQILNDIYEDVRTPERDGSGERVLDAYGMTVWVKRPSGAYEEDFSRLTAKAKSHLLLQITTHLFDWGQRAADIWTEAMFAKAQWEEKYAIAYDAGLAGTIEDHDARATIDSREERYFAIWLSALSRRADVIVRTMEAMALRLRDSLEG